MSEVEADDRLDGEQDSSCQECRREASVYQCPACRIRTCSLPCCQAHKKRTKCTGKRNRSEFLPLCRMSDDSLRSDYFFLEEVLTQMPRARKVARTEHDAGPHSNGISNINHSNKNRRKNAPPTSKKSRQLQLQAERRNITLQILPSFMERHRNNTSWYCGPRDMVTWKVECIMIPTNATLSFQISEHEENVLDFILRRHCSSSDKKKKKESFTANDEYKLFLKRLPSPANQPRYVEVTSSLRTVLEGMTIVEHPTLYCVLNADEHLKEFPTGTNRLVVVEEQQDAKIEYVKMGGDAAAVE